MMRRTSVWVHGLNDASDDDAILDAGGGGSPALPIARRGPSYRKTRQSCPQCGLCCQRRRGHGRAAVTVSATALTTSDRTGWGNRASTPHTSRGSDAVDDEQRRPSVDDPQRTVYIGSGVQDADSNGVQRDIRRQTKASDVQDNDG